MKWPSPSAHILTRRVTSAGSRTGARPARPSAHTGTAVPRRAGWSHGWRLSAFGRSRCSAAVREAVHQRPRLDHSLCWSAVSAAPTHLPPLQRACRGLRAALERLELAEQAQVRARVRVGAIHRPCCRGCGPTPSRLRMSWLSPNARPGKRPGAVGTCRCCRRGSGSHHRSPRLVARRGRRFVCHATGPGA